MTLNVLVACEESQAVCKAFRELGHRAFSCDLQECSGGHPEWHIQGDALKLINGNCEFITSDTHTHTHSGRWDLLIAHPPCTYLACSGERWFNTEKYGKKAEKRWRDRVDGAVFFMKFVAADCDHVAIENPVGVMGTAYRKADQIIQPYEFGHKTKKATCLWLKNLPVLQPTDVVEPEIIEYKCKNGKIARFGKGYMFDENGEKYGYGDPMMAKMRSKTYGGVAKAMAEQWSRYIEEGGSYDVVDDYMQYKLF